MNDSRPFYLDGETIPCQDPMMVAELKAELQSTLADELAAVKAPSNYKDPDKIAQFCAEKRAEIQSGFDAKFEDEYRKTGLDGTFGQLAIIGFAFETGDVQTLHVEDLSLAAEARLLREFFEIARPRSGRPYTYVGHNLIEFDLPFIWKRAIVHGIRPPFGFPRDPKPWSDNVFDTMTQWAGARGRISQDRLCRALGIPGKPDGWDGSKVWPAIRDGRMHEAVAYCADDVNKLRQNHRRMTFWQPKTELAVA